MRNGNAETKGLKRAKEPEIRRIWRDEASPACSSPALLLSSCFFLEPVKYIHKWWSSFSCHNSNSTSYIAHENVSMIYGSEVILRWITRDEIWRKLERQWNRKITWIEIE